MQNSTSKTNTNSSHHDNKTLKARKYIIATQDRTLRLQIQNIPGIPLVYFNKVILVLEPLSNASRQHSQYVSII